MKLIPLIKIQLGEICVWSYDGKSKRVKIMSSPIGIPLRQRVRIDHLDKDGNTVREGGYVNIDELYIETK